MIHFCCECRFSNIQIDIAEDLRKRLAELKTPMAMLERQNRGILDNKACCSLWRLAVDPLEKACYKWQSNQTKTDLNIKDSHVE